MILTQGHGCGMDKKNLLSCMIKRKPLIGSFWRSVFGNCSFRKLSLIIWDVFFKVKHYFGHISGMVGLIDVKGKGKTYKPM